MQTVIYYFSGTGNSLVLARDLAAALGAGRPVPLARMLAGGWDEQAEAVGIVFPVYMFGLPLIVAEFLRRVKVHPAAYVFTAATMGGLPGRAHTLARQILRQRGIELAGGFSVAMPGNYTPLYGAVLPQRQQTMFAGEKKQAARIAEAVKGRARLRLEEKPLWLNTLLHRLLYRGGSAQIPAAGKNFWITSACTACGLCEKVCPVANIRMQGGKPVWLDHCQQCMACLQWCPVAAIEYGKSTAGRKRYRHPDATAREIMEQR